jgi:hypothetical protein
VPPFDSDDGAPTDAAAGIRNALAITAVVVGVLGLVVLTLLRPLGLTL